MIELEKDKKFGNKISFSEEYQEKVLLRHFQGLYSNFELVIKPNSSNLIKLNSENRDAKKYLDSICEGLKEFIELYTKNDISINGFELTTRNDKFHSVDSKPVAYLIPITEALKKIFRKQNTQRLVLNPKLEGKNYSFKLKTEKINYQNLEWDEILTQELSRNFKETKYLNINGLIKISNCNINFHLESNINKWNTRGESKIRLRFKKDEFTPNEMVEYLRIIELIVADEHKKEINISGFIIYFEKNDLQVDTWKRKNEDIIFEWVLRNVLSSENKIKIQKEADR